MGEEGPRGGDETGLEAPTEATAGLCAVCRHRRLQRGERSVFVRCARASGDPSYPRYPRLPVLVCAGFERLDPA